MRMTRRLVPAPPVSLLTVVYIPELQGYWAESLEVLKLCLESWRATTPTSFELVVFDNGSCRDVRAYLEGKFDAGEVDQLFLSRRNLGKVGAWNTLFATAGGETVVYADSDVYFLPGWFEASTRIVEAFPEAAMVTAQPIPGDLSYHCEATLTGSASDPTIERREGADLIPEHFVESHRQGLGIPRERYAAARLRNRREVLLRRHGAEAYVSASHLQFMARGEVLRRVFPLPTSIPFGDDDQLDDRLDKAGHWRLSTADYLVHHMGNRPPDLGRELPWLAPDRFPTSKAATRRRPPRARPRGPGRRLLESRPVRRLLKYLHRTTYELLYME